ncbi:TIGR01457 family HAD-type hydrolase [Bacillus horti]|uniref:Acid sugar phosphatase n=1 Tax=Caldalkalibacillus horti TaxID=77523 RepID=A0ABT9VTU8_9BACI|nr:TIGR01457 family HAD-type hydrolase [Bacillus horti]MDQ0164410.1 4-nitrophenyl phosphatase [Bacillus horti]
MQKYKLYIIDLDGTMYRGTEAIEEAPYFINQIKELKQDYVFLTNNSTKTSEGVLEHLNLFGIQAEDHQIYSTSKATAQYISSQKKNANVYMIGEKGLKQALLAEGHQVFGAERGVEASAIDFVVTGLDRQITYEKLAGAVLHVRQGVPFISTNADKALPTERGLLPGNGSLTAVVQTATGVEPKYIGKPEPLMIEMILRERNLQKKEALMIGDNYETDILAGIRANINTAIVYTGFSKPEHVKEEPHKPTYEWNTLADAHKDIFV